jgi:hypothetical protein
MSLKLKSIADKGDLQKERLVLSVINDTDLGFYALLRTSLNNGVVTTGVHNAFWFPYKSVKAGDLVVVYSKRGTESQKGVEGGRTAHFLYWGRTEPLWGTHDKGVVLLYAPTWHSAGVDEL